MKKGIFWKIIAGLFVLWLFLFLWMNQWHYSFEGRMKTSKITGKTYKLVGGKWEPRMGTEKRN
jgi:hypothetical protein